MAALDQALGFLLTPSLPQSCGWPSLRSDQLFEEILLCVILDADWLSRLEGHSCIIFMATKKIENNRGQSAFKVGDSNPHPVEPATLSKEGHQLSVTPG